MTRRARADRSTVRAKTVAFRLTDEEYEALEAQARAQGISRGDLARNDVLAGIAGRAAEGSS